MATVIDEKERLVLLQRGLEAVKQRLAAEAYLSVMEVARRLGVSRTVVEGYPVEVLPYVDVSPTPGRAMRRYHPLDVAAADARLRGWKRAQQRGAGEAYLAQLRAELEERDRAAHELALQAGREVA